MSPHYLIHEHHARRLHWDLRLEYDGVLKSWALPKEPPTQEGIKRLAVQVEDHPLDYAKFEGTIPEGAYGAGEVKIWDKGTFETIESQAGKYVILLKGERLKGRYALIRTTMGGIKKNWLFMKTRSV